MKGGELAVAGLLVSAVIGSGLLSVVISIIYYRRHEQYLMKLEALKNYLGYRYTLDRGDLDAAPFFRTLNQIAVVFSKSKEVKGVLQALHDSVRSVAKGNSKAIDTDLLVRLYKAMCKDLHVETEDFTDEFFLRPFTPKRPGA